MTVASLVVALAAAGLLISGAVQNAPSLYRITTAWCILPFAWGAWVALAPRSWVPDRLPLWGAIFGLLLATIVLMVVNMPQQVFAVQWSPAVRAVGVVLAAGVYYLLWMPVRAVYRALAAR